MRGFRAGRQRGALLGWAALAVVYVVWGSTYLAIRVGVRDLPPLTMTGTRLLIAGLLLYPVALRSGGPVLRREDRPGRRQWLACLVIAVLLLVFGNGGLSLGEKTLSSGFAAVLVATVPLWIVAFAWPINHTRPTARASVGVLLGLAGVTVLAGASGKGHLGGVLIVLCSSMAWALGSVLARRLALPRRALLAAAMEMLIAGVLLLSASAAHGDLTRVHWSQVSQGSWFALAYLTTFGSILAFSAYGYALAHLPLTTVSTYAYVNPVVAVLLGVLILSERLSTQGIIGTAIVVASVALAIRPARDPVTVTVTAPATPGHGVPSTSADIISGEADLRTPPVACIPARNSADVQPASEVPLPAPDAGERNRHDQACRQGVEQAARQHVWRAEDNGVGDGPGRDHGGEQQPVEQ